MEVKNRYIFLMTKIKNLFQTIKCNNATATRSNEYMRV